MGATKILRRLALPAATGLLAIGIMVVAVGSTVQSQAADPDLSRVSPQKRAFIEREREEEARSRSQPIPPRGVHKAIPTPATRAQPGSGPARRAAGAGTIVETGLAPLAAAEYHIENRWYAVMGGVAVVVYAGGDRADSGQGLVVVGTGEQGRANLQVHRTPAKVGWLRVTSAEGQRLTLTSASGAKVVFDARSRTFVAP